MTAPIGKAALKVVPEVTPALKAFMKSGKFARVARIAPFVGAGFAVQDIADGNYTKGTVGLLGLVPGPIGWAATAAYTVWSLTDDGDAAGGNRVDQWAPPDGTTTFILPGAAKGINHVADLDRVLTDLNKNKIFGMTDGPQGQIWTQNPLPATRIDTVEVKAVIAAYCKQIAAASSEIRDVLQNSDEPKIRESAPSLLRHLAVLDRVPNEAGEVMVKGLTACSDAAAKAYEQILETNRTARTQLTNDGSLTDNSSQIVTVMKGVEASLDRAEQQMADVMKQAPLTSATFKGSTTARVRPQGRGGAHKPQPVSGNKPAMPTMPQQTETPEKKNTDDLANALKGLQNTAKQATPNTPSMPNLGSGGMPNLGGSNPLGNQGQNPLANLGDKLNEKKPEEKKDEPIKKREEPKKPDLSGLNNKVKPVEQKPEVKPEATPAAVAPAATVPGENKKPEEENKTPKPGAPKPNTTVDMKGTKVEFPNERVARMADLLGKADAEHPLTLTDAAAEAGLKPPVAGQDPGEQIPPTKAKPGDLLVAGDRQFLFLGDDKFYTDDYKVVSGSEVPELGDKGGWFHLPDDPNAAAADDKGGDQGGQGSGGQGPVSGPAEGGTKVENPAAGVETKPTPGTGDQGGSGQSGSGSGSGTPMPGSPSAKPGVTSSGEPGAPVQGGSGPGGTSGTNTGNGQGGSNSGSKPLDSAGIL